MVKGSYYYWSHPMLFSPLSLTVSRTILDWLFTRLATLFPTSVEGTAMEV